MFNLNGPTILIYPPEISFLDKAANHRNQYRNYNGRYDQWGRGLTNDPIFKGLCGEYAFSKYIYKKTRQWVGPDLEDKVYGDGGVDFELFDKKIQVKTSTQTDCLLIRVEKENGLTVANDYDILVSTFYAGIKTKRLQIILNGWISKENAFSNKYPIVPARRGFHKNREIPYTDLNSIESLFE